MIYGLPLWKLTPRLLAPVPPEFAKKPHLAVEAPAQRFVAWVDTLTPPVLAKLGNRLDLTYRGERERIVREWSNAWRSVPGWAVIEALGLDDALRLMTGDVVQSGVYDYVDALLSTEDRYIRGRHGEEAPVIEKGHPLSIWKKVQSSFWRYGMGGRDYNHVIAMYEQLRTFDFGVPGFEVRLDHASYFNERGLAWFHRCMPEMQDDPKRATLYIDGAFAYCVYLKGVHVLTIGFSLCDDGVLLQQVQLREKKGNRWLYKLPEPLLEHVIGRMRETFPEERLLLIDGVAAAQRIRRAYNPKDLTEEHGAKIDAVARVYDQPLARFERGAPLKVESAIYREVRPKQIEARCA